MPALPPVPGVVKLSQQFSYSGNATPLNRFFIHYSGTAPTSAQLSTFCGVVGTSWGANFVAATSGDVIGQSAAAEDLSSSTAAVGSATFSHTGTRTGDGLPPGTCAMEQFIIARRYRGGKPKIFLPFGTSTDLTGAGVWSGSALTAFNTAWANHIVAILAGGWTGAGTLTHVSVSYYEGFTAVQNPVTGRWRNVAKLRVGGPVVDAVVSYSIEQGISSQRRRNNV